MNTWQSVGEILAEMIEKDTVGDSLSMGAE